MKVTLRHKPISKGRETLYLDYYPPIIIKSTGKRTRREFLKLYIHKKPTSVYEKQHNKETKQLAEAIKAKRQLQIQNDNFEFIDQSKKNIDFLVYFKKQCEKRKNMSGTYGNWLSVYNHFCEFTNNQFLLSDLNEKSCNDFKLHLSTATSLRKSKTKLSQNSIHSYFNKFRAAVNQAFDDKLLSENPMKRIKGFKQEDSQREFLTLEELQLLSKTECEIPYLKTAAIFSALTGLRFSDISKLTWSEFRYSEIDGHSIRFKQKKTKGYQTLPISSQAYEMLDDKKQSENVFPDLDYSAWLNQKLKDWINSAGITKKITFHCFRHTYATLQLSLGTDIMTVSKMLGHKDLKTTQIYAKVIDQKKRDAANRIKI